MNGWPVYLLLCWPLVQAGVVQDFNHVERCKDSLYMGTPPRGYLNRAYKKICQRLQDRPRYVTLYDPHRHMPIYSAYTFKKSDGEKSVDQPWMYEPQLASSLGSSNMEPFSQLGNLQRLMDSQATLEDYADVVQYERGHLNPDQHQADPVDKAATYALTNVVPQIREFNTGPWAQHEERIRQRLNNYCRGTPYVVTGTTTAGNMIRRNNNNRVGIPEYMWTAYCCTDFDHNAPYLERYRFPAFGAYGLNDRVNNAVVEVPLKTLEKFLKDRMEVDKNFQIFYSLVKVVLMVLMWKAGCQGSPLRAVCDPRVLERFIREARDTEAAMRSCGGSCAIVRVYTVPLTNVDFTDWEQKDVEGQVAEVQVGLSLLVQALNTFRGKVSGSPISSLLDNNISNIQSLINIIHSLNTQTLASRRRSAQTQTHSSSELLRTQTNFLRGKVKLLLSAACRTLDS